MSCQITSVSVDVQPGSGLAPTGLIVRGNLTCQNAAATVVTVSTNVTGVATGAPDPAGNFSFVVPVTTPVVCGSKANVSIVGQCKDGSSCSYQNTVVLDCGACARANLSATQSPCSGGLQPIELNADIVIPAGATYTFYWQTGSSLVPNSAQFMISNVGGLPSTVHTAPPFTANYPPGNYVARLVQVSPASSECPRLEIPIVATCVSCPSVTGSANVGACDPNGHRTVTYTLTFSPPIPQGATASAVITYGGSDVNGNTSGQASINTAAGTVSSATLAATFAPGTYQAVVVLSVTSQGQTCSAVVFSFPTVVVGSCLPCPLDVTVAVATPPANWCIPPTGPATGVANLLATVVWPTGAAPHPAPTEFDWTVTLPNGLTAKQSNVPPNVATNADSCRVDTASNWTGSGSAGGAINLNQVGTYSISVVAKFPPSAGLPTNQDGTSQCNLSGSGSFALALCSVTVPPPCPSILITATNASCADPAAGTSATITFAATVIDPAGLATGIDWNFGDPASGAQNTLSTPPGVLTATHSFASAGSYPVTASLKVTGTCSPRGGSTTASLSQIIPTCPCPPGMARNASGVCVPTTPPPPPPSTSSTLCCFLIGAWTVLSIAFSLMLFYRVYSYWPVGTIIFIVVGGLATVALGVWIALCCWPCALTFWRCCVFLQWQFVMASISATIMGILQFLCSRGVSVVCGDQTILFIYTGYIVALFALLSSIASCGRLPNPFDPRTWPPCCCPGSKCP